MLSGLVEKALMKAFEKLWPIIVEKITALLPVIVASLTKLIGDQLRSALPNIQIPDVTQLPAAAKSVIDRVLDADPDWPGISNIFDLTEHLKRIGL
jgi:hypothetical protein